MHHPRTRQSGELPPSASSQVAAGLWAHAVSQVVSGELLGSELTAGKSKVGRASGSPFWRLPTMWRKGIEMMARDENETGQRQVRTQMRNSFPPV